MSKMDKNNTMDITSLLEKIKKRNLYHNILEIEGVRDPIFNLDKLNLTADKIHDRFDNLGLAVAEQQFTVEGFDGTFRNIEATFKNAPTASEDYVILTSHYDTVPNTVGANDNASAIALQFEIARILTEENLALNVKFVSFTLEELNPFLVCQGIQKAQELGLKDAQNRISSYHFKQIRKKMDNLYSQLESEGISGEEITKRSLATLKPEMTPKEIEYYTYFQSLYPSKEGFDSVGFDGFMGSSHWVDRYENSASHIKKVFNFDEIAFTSKKKYSHFLPDGLPISQFPQYRLQLEDMVGNFIIFFSDTNSEWMLDSLFQKAKALDLPYLGFPTQMDYATMKQQMPQMLAADHAPFWRAGIPCILVTDMGEYRSPYAHNMGDTIDILDFDFLKKVTQITLASLLEN